MTERRSYRIGALPGDGIGPEVVRQGLRVLETASKLFDFRYELTEYPWNSQLYLDSGQLMPESTVEEFRALDALFLGAIGDPRAERGVVERSIIMGIRFGLDLYINLRPVALYAEHVCPLKGMKPEDIDMVVVRENTEDCYAGLGGSLRPGTADEIAIAEMVYTRRGVERAIRYAFELARSRDKQRRVTLVDKSNAIRAQEVWRRTFAAVGQEFPDIERHELYVDAAAMMMISDPQRFDVVVTTNLFGDILTDLGAVIQGGLGAAASGNIHPGQVSMFEPIHGSAPDIAGQNRASPIGAIAALAMMLDYIGETAAARSIEDAIRSLIGDGSIQSFSASSALSTDETGSLVLERLERDHAGTASPRLTH